MKSEVVDAWVAGRPGHISIAHIRAFAAAADGRSLSDAALRLGMSQSSLSRCIRDLEAELGTAMFTRSWAGVSLSPAGAHWLPQARRILACHDEALHALAPWQQGAGHRMTLAGSNGLVPLLLPRLMQLLSGLGSDPGVDLDVGFADRVQDHVLSGRSDLGLCALVGNNPDLRRLPLLEAPLGLLCAPELPLPATISSLDDLRGLPLVRYRRESVISELLHEHGVHFEAYERASLVLQGTQALADMALGGQMVMLASGTVASSAWARALRFTPLPGLLPPVRQGLIWRHDRPFDTRMERIKEIICDAVLAADWQPSVQRLRAPSGGGTFGAADAEPVAPAQARPPPVQQMAWAQPCVQAGDAESPAGQGVHRVPLPAPLPVALEASARDAGIGLKDVDAFLALAVHGSFRQAAASVCRSQSALSRRMQDFEQRLGVALFRRGRQGVHLSEAGQAFVKPAQALQTCCRDALIAWQTWTPEAPVGRMLAITPAMLPIVLPTLLRLAAEAFPGGALTFQGAPSRQVVQGVARAEADFGLCMSSVQGPAFVDGQALLEAPMGLLVNPAMSLPERIASPEDLYGLPLARVADDVFSGQTLRAHGLDDRRCLAAAEVHANMAAVITAVHGGRVACLVSALSASNALAEGLLFRPLPGLLPMVRLCLIGPPQGVQRAADAQWLALLRTGTLAAAWRPEVRRLVAA